MTTTAETAAATTARSRSMAQCHFARAPRPYSPRSSPPTLTICPHRALSRGCGEIPFFPRFISSIYVYSFPLHPTSFISSVFFLELLLDIALCILHHPSLISCLKENFQNFCFVQPIAVCLDCI